MARSGDPASAGSGDPASAGSGDPASAGSGDPVSAGSGDPASAGSGDPASAGSSVRDLNSVSRDSEPSTLLFILLQCRIWEYLGKVDKKT